MAARIPWQVWTQRKLKRPGHHSQHYILVLVETTLVYTELYFLNLDHLHSKISKADPTLLYFGSNLFLPSANTVITATSLSSLFLFLLCAFPGLQATHPPLPPPPHSPHPTNLYQFVCQSFFPCSGPSVRGMDPDPPIIKQKSKKNIDSTVSTGRKEQIRSRIQSYKSEDTEPYQSVTDPELCFIYVQYYWWWSLPGTAEDMLYGDPGLLHGLAHQPRLQAAHHRQGAVAGKPLRARPPLWYTRYKTQKKCLHLTL